MNKGRLIILFILALIQIGCIYIPLPHTKSGDIEIDESFIKEGVTTKEDILLRFGSPTRTGRDETEMVYEWTRFYGVWGTAGAFYMSCWLGGGDHVCSVITWIQLGKNDVVSYVFTTRQHDSPHGMLLH